MPSLSSSGSFYSTTMEGTHQSMLLDPARDDSTPPFSWTPEPSPEPQAPIPITPRMWEAILNRMTVQDMVIEELKHDLQALRDQHTALEHDHYTLATSAPRTHALEPKIPDPPMFNGDCKELLPFLTKCQLKFEGQPSLSRMGLQAVNED